MSRDDLRLSPAWAAVLVSVVGIVGTVALGAGRVLYAPKGDYATKSQVDSLRWEVQGTNARLDVLLLQHIPDDVRPDHHDRAGRRPAPQEVFP